VRNFSLSRAIDDLAVQLHTFMFRCMVLTLSFIVLDREYFGRRDCEEDSLLFEWILQRLDLPKVTIPPPISLENLA